MGGKFKYRIGKENRKREKKKRRGKEKRKREEKEKWKGKRKKMRKRKVSELLPQISGIPMIETRLTKK